jgi:hypothetical protein
VSPRDWRGRVQDILDAIAEIQAFTHGMDFDSFRSDAKTVRAVELDLIVIGEATSQVPDEIEERYPQIPWPLMRNAKPAGACVFLGGRAPVMGHRAKRSTRLVLRTAIDPALRGWPKWLEKWSAARMRGGITMLPLLSM